MRSDIFRAGNQFLLNEPAVSALVCDRKSPAPIKHELSETFFRHMALMA
jgi:hypothetical protein